MASEDGGPVHNLQQFIDLTGCDSYQASFLLEAARGDFQAALNMFYDQGGIVPAQQQSAPQAPVHQRYTPPRPRAPVQAGQQQLQQHQGPRRGLIIRSALALLNLPFRTLRFALGALPSLISWGLSAIAVVGNRFLPASVTRWLRGVASHVRGPVAEPDPLAQAAAFVAAFKAAHGDRHPRFVESSWRDATLLAQREFKFLFVYLHAPDHQDTQAFCRDVLTAPEIVDFVNHNFVAWAGDVRSKDAFMLASRLKVTRYPYVGLLAFGGSRTRLVAALQGAAAAEEVLGVLVRAVDEQGALLVAERAESQEREMSRRLLEEQNREYEEALAADRERERRREEERRAAEEQERLRLEERERVRRQKEEEDRAAAQAALEAEQRRRAKAASLPPEPKLGEPCAALRIRLPDGMTHQRRFNASHTLQEVFDFVESLEEFAYPKYSLVSNFPRRVFDTASAIMTLEEAGLAPQGALFVQPD